MSALLVSLLACGNFSPDNSLAGDMPMDSDDIPPGTLKIDIRPAASESGLLPQSFILAPGSYEDVELGHTMSPTATIRGTLLATTVQGWSSAAASATLPLQAVVRATHGNLLQGGVATTDETGSLDLPVPANQMYALEILPASATESPFVYLVDQNVLADNSAGVGLDLSTTLSAGAPVYGRVTDSASENVALASLHLCRADVPVCSATFTTDKNGWFVARVDPGYDYVLVTEGEVRAEKDVSLAIPEIAVPFTVEAGDVSGVEVDVNVGDRTTQRVSMRVQTDDGSPARYPHVRATSESLATGALVVEREGQDDGQVVLDLPAGTWTLEVWPNDADDPDVVARADATPWVVEGLRIGADVDLPKVTLQAPTVLSGVVHVPSGKRAAGVTVTAVEAGFGEFTFSTVTDDDGKWSMSVPRTDVRLTAVPLTSADGAYTHASLSLADAGETTEVELDLVEGTPVTGVVTSQDGPVAFALVELYDYAADVLLARALTDADGAYSVRVDLPESDPGDTGADTGTQDTGDTAASDTGAP